MLFRSLTIWLLLAGSLFSQEIGGLSTLPVLTDGRYPVRGLAVPAGSLDELSKWAQRLVVAVSGPEGAETSIELDIGLVKRQPVLYFSADKSGLYVLMLVDTGAKESAVIVTKRVNVGEVVPPAPNPTPPGPTPNPTPPPTPTPVPVTSGKRIVLIVREAGEVPPAIARMEVSLRNGESAKYLQAKGHNLLILSDDQDLPLTAPPAVKQAFEQAKGKAPAVAIVDAASKDFSGVLFVDALPPHATDGSILALVKEHGG
jgi:hypothetical protein